MKISRKNAARLASLTALGAGALAISPRAAEADIIYTPENITLTPPIRSGTNSKSIAVTASFRLGFSASKGSTSSVMRMRVSSSGAGAIAVAVAAAGQTWNQVQGAGGARRSNVRLGSKSSRSSPSSTSTGGGTSIVKATHIPANEPFYKLFTFTPAAGGTDYGWVSLSEGVNKPNQLYLKVNGLAYDNTGAVIPAGASPVPEPSPLILAGLGMLVLGAEGLRRFRAAKQAA